MSDSDDGEPQSIEEEEKLDTVRRESDLIKFAPKGKTRGKTKPPKDDNQMSEQLRKSLAKRESESLSESSASGRRRGKRTPNIGVLVAKAWREDQTSEDIRAIASDEAGGGREAAESVDAIVAEIEREHGSLDELDENPETVYGMDIQALFRFCLQRGMLASDTRELMTIIGRIVRRVKRRRGGK